MRAAVHCSEQRKTKKYKSSSFIPNFCTLKIGCKNTGAENNTYTISCNILLDNICIKKKKTKQKTITTKRLAVKLSGKIKKIRYRCTSSLNGKYQQGGLVLEPRRPRKYILSAAYAVHNYYSVSVCAN